MYYTLENNKLKPLTGLVKVGEVQKNAQFLTNEEAASLNAYRNAANPPDEREGYTAGVIGYELKDGAWWAIYAYSPIAYTEDDYNYALEEHLRNERVARGYDQREPSLYSNSSIPRWAQDAADWTKHVDEVMMFGLGVLNEWKVTGKVMPLLDFKDALPKIVWSYTEA